MSLASAACRRRIWSRSAALFGPPAESDSCSPGIRPGVAAGFHMSGRGILRRSTSTVAPGSRRIVVELTLWADCHAHVRSRSARSGGYMDGVHSVRRAGTEFRSSGTGQKLLARQPMRRFVPQKYSREAAATAPPSRVRDMSVPTATIEVAHEWTAVRVPGPPSRQPRSTARCPRGRAGTQRVQAVDVRRWRRQERPRHDRTTIERHRCGTARTH
jgi:hypothetical protein